LGGHDPETVKLLDACARGKGKEALFRKLMPGTVLVREFQGVRHTVTIVEGAFLWNERRYSNLSAIAQAITGTNWNGPRFFGLRQEGAGKAQKTVARLASGSPMDGSALDSVVGAGV
jgi:hypothetical protein